MKRTKSIHPSAWNVVYHHRTQGRGVEAVHIMNVVDALRASGHCVDIVSPPGADPSAEDVGATGKRQGPWSLVSRHMPQFLFELLEVAYNASAWARLRRAVRARDRIDLYYERYALFLFAGTWLMKRRGVPVVLEVNDSAHVERVRPLLNARLARRIERWCFAQADALVVITEAFKQILVSGGVDAERIHVVHNTARGERFSPDVDGAEVRRRHGLVGATVLGFIGKAVPWHGVDCLLLAARDLADRHPELQVLVVGDTSGHPELQAIAADAALVSRVHFTGQVPHAEAASHIAAMDIAVMPNSNAFGSPVKLFEYMAMEKAIVAPRLGPVQELFIADEEAVLVEPGNRESMRAALQRLLEDPALRRRIASAAHKRFVREFSAERNAARTLEILAAARAHADATGGGER